MTKHIVGVIIFSLIVGTSAVIAGLFGLTTKLPKANSVTVSDSYRIFKKKRKRRCRKKRRPHPREISATVAQATYDEVTGQLSTEINLTDEGRSGGDLELHFFVKDAYGTQYLKKETIGRSSDRTIFENSFGWLSRLESKKNLYVIAEVRDSYRRWDYPPEFDSSKATPVLIKSVD